MGVIESDLGGYTPICSDCGVVLCYDITENDYNEVPEFWDAWRCDVCNPNARFALTKALFEKRKLLLDKTINA